MIRSDFIAWVALILIAAAIGAVIWIYCMGKWASWIDPKRIKNKAARQKLDEIISRSEIDRFKKRLFALEKRKPDFRTPLDPKELVKIFRDNKGNVQELLKEILRPTITVPLGNFVLPPLEPSVLKTGNYKRVRWFKKKEIKEALESEKNKRRNK